MCADISALGETKQLEPLDMDMYQDSKGFKPMPTKGEYLLRAPEAFPPDSWRRTGAGALSAQVDSTIVGGEFDGHQVKFQRVSAKQFKRNGKTVSQMGDYLRAFGVRGVLNDEQQLADAVEGTANLTYKAYLDWRARNSKTGFTVEGMDCFPSDGNGGHIPFYPDPTEKDENGAPVRLRANLEIRRFIPSEG